MIQANVPHYLEPHRFTTRSSEVSKEKLGKEFIWWKTLSEKTDAPFPMTSKCSKHQRGGLWHVTSWVCALSRPWSDGIAFWWTQHKFQPLADTRRPQQSRFSGLTEPLGFAWQKGCPLWSAELTEFCHLTWPWMLWELTPLWCFTWCHCPCRPTQSRTRIMTSRVAPSNPRKRISHPTRPRRVARARAKAREKLPVVECLKS